ncbi:MAG: hypothetical protein K0Q51_1538 [Rickettsiaceae bacterium]|jgi:hypothetical protein|nr:hypothetical protein [Rickettsiaceae bacterium]
MSKERPNIKPKPSRKVDQEIVDVINLLLTAEKNEEGKSTKASTEPYFDKELKKHNINFDSLARLLTGNETCAAIFYNGSDLLIASNRRSPEYAKRYCTLLEKYTNSPFKDNYQSLENEANRQVASIIKDYKKDPDNLEIRQDKAILYNDVYCLELLNKIIMFLTKTSSDDNDLTNTNELQSIQELSKEIISDSKASIHAKELAIEVLKPIIDMRVITNAIESKEDLELEIIQAMKQGKVKYIEGSPLKHAEMKILDQLINQDIIIDKYIGISKLACWPCGAVLITLNSGRGYLQFSGTHGGTYPGWEAPTCVVNNPEFKKKFLTLLKAHPGKYIKGKEAYPYFENFIPEIPLLATFNDLNEAVSFLNGYEQRIKELKEKIDIASKDCIKLKEDKKLTDLKLQSISDKNDQYNGELNKLKKFKQEATSARREQSDHINAWEKLKELTEYKTARHFILTNIDQKFIDSTLREKLRKQKNEREKLALLKDAYKNKYHIKDKVENKNLNSKLEPLKHSIKDIEKDLNSLTDKRKTLMEKKESQLQQINALEEYKHSLEDTLNNIKHRKGKLALRLEKAIDFQSTSEEDTHIHEEAESKLSSYIDQSKVIIKEYWKPEQIIDTLKSNLNQAEYAYAIVMNEDTLKKALGEIPDNKNYILIMNVNSVTKELSPGANGSDSNHWVALYIPNVVENNNNQTTIYLDPMGHPMSKSVKVLIYSLIKYTITEPIIGKGIQYVEKIIHKGKYENIIEYKGNNYDCGPLLTYLLLRIARKEPFIDAIQDKDTSEQLGQQIRNAYRDILSTSTAVTTQDEDHGQSETIISFDSSKDPTDVSGDSLEFPSGHK